MAEKQYQHFKASDFALDDSFVRWVKQKDPEAGRMWEQWSAAHPQKQGEIDQARRLVLAMKFEETMVTASETGDAWDQLRQNQGLRNGRPLRQNKIRHVRLNPVAGIAAVLLAIVTFVFIAWHFTVDRPVTVPLVQTIIKENPNGQKLSIMLPDGTEIKLNSDSRLTYSSDFGQKSREVTLEGEAFFDVRHNGFLPFIVRTAKVKATVLGTSFNVNAYPEDPEVKVALVTGRVRVESEDKWGKNQETMLKPKEMVAVKVADASARVSAFDPVEITGWKDGVLYFQRAKFVNTINKLDRWYGVGITVEDGMKTDPDWLFSGSFKNKSLEYVLNTLGYPDLFSFDIDGKKITIKPFNKTSCKK